MHAHTHTGIRTNTHKNVYIHRHAQTREHCTHKMTNALSLSPQTVNPDHPLKQQHPELCSWGTALCDPPVGNSWKEDTQCGVKYPGEGKIQLQGAWDSLNNLGTRSIKQHAFLLPPLQNQTQIHHTSCECLRPKNNTPCSHSQ